MSATIPSRCGRWRSRTATLPGLVEAWDLIINGVELGTAYSELNDPVIQRERLVAQSLLAAGGDPEAMELDEDFLRAMEFGMPPAGGMGMGLDRLIMLFTGAGIRETILFPFWLRPEYPAPELPRSLHSTTDGHGNSRVLFILVWPDLPRRTGAILKVTSDAQCRSGPPDPGIWSHLSGTFREVNDTKRFVRYKSGANNSAEGLCPMAGAERLSSMAQRVQVVLEDDLDGDEADETVTFGLDGTTYEIDLSKKNAAELRDALAGYVGPVDDRVSRSPRRSGPVTRGDGAGRPLGLADIRAWARRTATT